MARQGQASRWLAPAGVCVLVSLTCLAFLFSSTKPGGKFLTPKRIAFADTYATFALPEHPCTGQNAGLVDFMAESVRAVRPSQRAQTVCCAGIRPVSAISRKDCCVVEIRDQGNLPDHGLCLDLASDLRS